MYYYILESKKTIFFFFLEFKMTNYLEKESKCGLAVFFYGVFQLLVDTGPNTAFTPSRP